MDKKELYQYTGSIQQLASIRPVTCMEGRSKGMKMYQVKNGCLEYKLMADKCLDMAELSYKGFNLSFLSKPGLQGRNQYDTNGEEALRSIMGGFFFTAGMENICAPYKNETGDYPMHGRVRTTPAEQLSSWQTWEDGQLHLGVSGEMREAELFGENLVLRRKIETVFGTKTIRVTDEIENEAYREEPLMLLYHINLGYPFLTPDVKLYIPTLEVTARDENGRGKEKDYDHMDLPKDNEPEYVFIHKMKETEDKKTWLLAVNTKLDLGIKIAYDRTNMPYFMEWKSIASGDYVIGLEPSNSSVYGRKYHEEHKNLHRIGSFEKERYELEFTILDGKEEIKEAVSLFNDTFK